MAHTALAAKTVLSGKSGLMAHPAIAALLEKKGSPSVAVFFLINNYLSSCTNIQNTNRAKENPVP